MLVLRRGVELADGEFLRLADVDVGGVRRCRALAAGGDEQLVFPRVGRDVAAGEDPLHVRVHPVVGLDLVSLELEPPLPDNLGVHQIADVDGHEVEGELFLGPGLLVRHEHRSDDAGRPGFSANLDRLRVEHGADPRGLLDILDVGVHSLPLVEHVDQRHVGDLLQRNGRLQRAVAAADHKDTLTAALLGVRHAVRDAATLELDLARFLDLPRLEGAASGGDDDGLRLVVSLGRGHADHVRRVVALDHGDVLGLSQLRTHVVRLVDEIPSQGVAHDVGVGGEVVNRLLGIERGELAAGDGGVKEERRHPAHPREESGREPGGAGADDEHFPDHAG